MVDAREYHERTKHSPRSVRESDFELDYANRPRPDKRYVDLPRRDLPGIRPPMTPALAATATRRADPLAGTDEPRPAPPSLSTLATLCYEASGVTKRVDIDGETTTFRAASCTGKLYHVDCYLVCGDLSGLEAGVYHFDPATFSLDVLREGDYRSVLANAVGGPDRDPTRDDENGDGGHPGVATAPVTLVTTSTWWRNAWKYRQRTYRHAFWDSGTVLANLLAAAHALGYRASVVAGFADGPVADLLGVDPEREAPLELVPVGSDTPAPDAPAVTPLDPATEPLSPDPVDYPLVGEAWTASTLADGAEATAWRERCRDVLPLGRSRPGDGERVPLDPVDPATATARPLHDTVLRRGSCREYAGEPVSRRQVGTVLDRATRGVPGDWTDGTAEGLATLEAYCLVTGVEGVPDGAYQYYPAADDLERLGDVDRGTKTQLALEQRWAGDAHVNVYLVADVETLVADLGNRGYRLAQLEAGVTLGRLYLTTYAHRTLGGTGLTFYDDLVTDHLSPRAAGTTPACLFVFGRAD